MSQKYALNWLDTLISTTLNPDRNDLAAMTEDDVSSLILEIDRECLKLQSSIQQQIFGVFRERQIEVLVRQYHTACIILLDQVNGQHREARLEVLYNKLSRCIDDLLSFIETRYSRHLSLDERVPATYLEASRDELRVRLNKLRGMVLRKIDDKKLAEIIMNALSPFINDQPLSGATFRILLYHKELILGLEQLKNTTNLNAAVNELLVYLNFNDRAYVSYFTKCLGDKVAAQDLCEDKIKTLLFHSKEFSHMHRKEGVKFNEHHADLKAILGEWFAHEISYLERVQLSNSTEPQAAPPGKQQKLVCSLSVDQMALVLRAADDLKIVIARSMNAVFKIVTPYLATQQKDTISYDSMRSKSYAAESKDKRVAIDALEKMISKIREY
jgi:hypothetical protein